MSRSTRKTPIVGITKAPSEKNDKRVAQRRFRRKAKVSISQGEDPPEDLNEIADVWTFDKDGKQFFNEDEHPELMRK